MYEKYFEAPYLQSSAEFYGKKSRNLLEEETISGYIRQVKHIIRTEKERASNYLDTTSLASLEKVDITHIYH